ncbi:MAG: hypothetical protein QM597_00285 [Aeromicrobium sp.]|uniref:hypothetical protein n=1 Tax=Aeromicrobium sp. TaxID=1871063 RepID=UPI0039E6283B
MYEFASTVLVVTEQRGLDPDIVRPGWTALGIFVAMAVALGLLMWSFAKVSRRAREPWEGEEVSADAQSVRDGDRRP